MSDTIRGSRRWREVIIPRVIRRDGGICHLCGKPGANTADHVIAVVHGGTDDMTNLAAAHIPCNQRRGARPIEAVRADLAREAQTQPAWRW